MNEGGLIPYQLTVQVLVNALIAQPSQVSFNALFGVTKVPPNVSLSQSLNG